ncbi:MAG: phospholipase [Actinobacteria bacterium]|nr:phospholipase [Actinomycetota bacterium]
MNGCESWFLTAEQRGNPATTIDDDRDGRAWTDGNRAEPLVDGHAYFARLHEVLCRLRAGDWVHLTDWRGDCDERLNGPGTEIGPLLAELAERGVHVRGLLWRSHPLRMHLSEGENLRMAHLVNHAGGEMLLDERVRRAGSHHQKLVLVRHPHREDDDLAFVGGIDLCHGRNDGGEHAADPQAADLSAPYGEQPPWHDVQLELQGPAVADVALTFRERWEDPTALDHANPLRWAFARLAHQPRRPQPLPPMPARPAVAGSCSVQVLRTYPAKHPAFPFAPEGERSIARAYHKAFARARSFIYLEDQYLWSDAVADLLEAALGRAPDLRLLAVVPRHPERDGRLSGPPSRVGQQEVIDRLRRAGGDRVAVYDLENRGCRPIYVHAKACVVDDVWAIVGSDNLNMRSWTHDSELSCAVLDERLDPREPADPGGMGDGARIFARDLRLRLWREHLAAPTDDGLLDPVAGFDAWRRAARAIDAWHAARRRGPRPPGQPRVHEPGRLGWWTATWARPLYHAFFDPDGRPREMRGTDAF